MSLVGLNVASRKSLFLFGPRQTGKSTLLKNLFHKGYYINLLESEQPLKYQQGPMTLREEVLTISNKLPTIINEIQKLPILLDEIHHLFENYSYRFILTGSSSRNLRRSSTNLLADRVL